jgi:hypothetical protein
MKIFKLNILLCFIAFQAFGQNDQTGDSKRYVLDQINMGDITSPNVAKILDQSNLDGSPYLEEDFILSKVVDQNQNKTMAVYARYRIFDDVFEMKQKPTSSKEFSIPRTKDFEVFIDNKKYMLFTDYPIEMNGTYSGYARVLYSSNKLQLIKRITQTYIKAEPPKNSYSSPTNAALENNVFYFVVINDQIFQVEAHKRRAADGFPNHQEKLEDFIKDEKLKFKSDEEDADLIKLAIYYQTLI